MEKNKRKPTTNQNDFNKNKNKPEKLIDGIIPDGMHFDGWSGAGEKEDNKKHLLDENGNPLGVGDL